MSNKFIVALDQGSSSSRALAFDSFGQVAAKQTVSLSPDYPAEGLAQYDGETLFKSQLDALHRVLDSVGAAEVAALAVSSQRSTVVLWDKQTGVPLCPVLTWQDGRALKEAEDVALSQEDIHARTGLYKTPFYSAAKIAWCLRHCPAVEKAAQANRLCIGPVGTYLIWRLTGGMVFAADPSLAQRMLLLNINTLQWDDVLLGAFGVKKEWLPEIKPSVSSYSFYEYKGVKIPIIVCIGDQQAALCAAGFTQGNSLINYGTGAFFLHNTGRNLKLVPGILTSVCASDGNSCDYMLEGPVNAAGSAFRWLKELGIDFDMKELDGLYQQSKSPILFLPALGGLGAPYWDFSVSPVLAGLSPQTKKADIVAGTLRGIAFLLADIMFYLRKSGVKITDVRVSGGIAGSRSLLQFQADILQIELNVCPETESSALGAAWLAARSQVATAVLTPNDAAERWQNLQMPEKITPQVSAVSAQELYKAWQGFITWCRTRKG